MKDYLAEASGITDKPEAVIFIYVTYPTVEVAKNVSKKLVEQKLVACANIFPPHDSMFLWEGDFEAAKEVSVYYKAPSQSFHMAKDLIEDHHPYDIPCIVSWDISGGNDSFLEWVRGQAEV